MTKSKYYEIRQAAGASGSKCPVKMIDEDKTPELTGSGYCYRTRGGTYIRYPSAYSKTGWSNMVYHASTYCILVGKEWVKENAPEVIARIVKEKIMN